MQTILEDDTPQLTCCIRARLTIIDIETSHYPVILGGILSINEEEIYVAIPGYFWPGTRFRVEYMMDSESQTIFGSVDHVDPESPDGTERLGHCLKIIPDPFE
jgi:hypothetical protein